MRHALAALALLVAVSAGAAPADAPVAGAAQAPTTAAPTPFECPQEGRGEGATAPSDYHAQPDARCVTGGLVTLYGPDGKPYAQMTKVGPGWYLTAEGYRLADAAFRRVQAERDAARAELSGRQALPGVPVRSAPAAASARWPTPVVVGAAVVGLLVGGFVGCRATGGCR
ncbi:hypothetical protein D7X74_21290 [Corallococcus sp. CA047B]|uniref:hypothetical protein n=1 Tax=Corallococcus sp. CA047B TaxID=2316729 RepID=UPI000EA01DC7|nr:hypothetical protein [Corallococcus sp. CA047B]RKH13784.1 hypothetical protein D7X74_21290 [Corallococcus sp. CA047B]